MKKITALLTILFTLGILGTSFGFEISSQVKLGTINWWENDTSEGHKYLELIGLEIRSGSVVKKIAGFEVWRMGELLDEDTEIPNKGYSFYMELDYNKKIGNHLTIYPYIKTELEKFGRNKEGNIKYEESWSSVRYIDLTLGGGLNYKSTYIKMGLILPPNGKTNNGLELEGKSGFDLELGTKWKKFTFGYFYKRVTFDEFDGHPNFKLNRSGVIIRYSF